MANEVTEILEDFSDGLNTRFAPNRIPKTATPTATNCWYDVNALAKRAGSTVLSTSATLSNMAASIAWRGVMIKHWVNASADSLIMLANIGKGRNVFVASNNATTFTVMHNQEADNNGTLPASCNTTSGSPTVTFNSGSPTPFMSVGDFIYVKTTTDWLQIQSIDSGTQITATANATATDTSVYLSIPGFTATARASFAEMNSAVWICSQGGGSLSAVFSIFGYANFKAAFPKASYNLTYKNYMFAAATAANPSRVSWSSLKDPTTWPATNFVDVNPDDGFPIVGMFVDGQSIVILKTNQAYKLTGEIFDPANPTYTLQPIYVPSDFLISGPGSIQLMNGKFIMLGEKGFYSYTGGSTINFIEESSTIRDQFATIAGFSLVAAPSVSVEPQSIMVDGKYWLSVESSTFSHTTGFKNVIWVIDEEGAFWRWNQGTSAQVSGFAYRQGTLYGVNADTGASAGLQTLNTGTVDTGSVAINGTWTSRVFEYPNQQQFLVANVMFKKQSAGNLTFEYSIDEGSFASATIDMTVGSGTRVKSQNITLGTVGSSIQFRLSNATASQTFEVYGIQWIRRPLKQ